MFHYLLIHLLFLHDLKLLFAGNRSVALQIFARSSSWQVAVVRYGTETVECTWKLLRTESNWQINEKHNYRHKTWKILRNATVSRILHCVLYNVFSGAL